MRVSFFSTTGMIVVVKLFYCCARDHGIYLLLLLHFQEYLLAFYDGGVERSPLRFLSSPIFNGTFPEFKKRRVR